MEESKSTRTRRRILASAARELSLYGYGGMSLRKVAAGAQMQQGSLYFHFASKDELVAATLAEGVEFASARITAALDALPADADGRVRLEVTVREHVSALHASQDLSAAVVRMVHTLPLELRETHDVHARRYGRLWRDVLFAAQRDGYIASNLDLDQLTSFVIWGLNSYLVEVSAIELSTERLADITSAVVGLLAGRPRA